MPKNNYCLYKKNTDLLGENPLTDKCIVLDLDQTLVATQETLEDFKRLKIMSDPKLFLLRSRSYYLSMDDYEKPGIGTVYNYWGVTRPYTKEFLQFCFAYFKVVAVWSAGKAKYVESIVDHLFADLPQPHVIFTYDDIEKGDKIIKPLSKMYQYDDFTRKYMNASNTFILDDNNSTFSKNKGNAIHIPAYDPKVTIKDLSDTSDDNLVKVMYWLCQKNVIESKNVTKLKKNTIFTKSIQEYKA